MPRLAPTDDEQIMTIPGAGNIQFSAVRMDKLGASQYSLITVVADRSGSTEPFEKSLNKLAQAVVETCNDKNNPRRENLLLRYLIFNDTITEVHGFKLLSSINPDDYDLLESRGSTALFGATDDAVGATLTLAERLISQDYDVNGAIYIITDGMNNVYSSATPETIMDRIKNALGKETIIDSLLTILIGLYDPKIPWSNETKKALETFKDDAALDDYIDAGEATPENLAKICNYVSGSVSSVSQGLQSGVQSQPLTF